MTDNKVIFTLELQQKGNKLSVVQKQTDKLAKSTKNVETAERKRNKTASTTYSRQKQGLIQTANSTKNFSKLAGSIDGGGGGPGGLVRAYALLAANVFALSAAFNVFSRAAQIDTLVASMKQLEIVSGNSIMGVARDLQAATGFGMSFAESMRAVSLATSAGFSGDQISKLGEVARNAAVSLGRNLPDALDRIFRGVIKVEPELLDEIGLFVRVNDASAKYAATLGKSVGDLTEFEKRQAFLNEALTQGTSKFAAFADIENDPFALLATTFADISQAVLSFMNNAIGPTVKFLAENKMIFSTVFGAVAFILFKMAIPAMGAFTNSMAVNAATAKASSDKIVKANRVRAQESRKSHKAFLVDELEKKKALAATARAASQSGPQGRLSVRGKVKVGDTEVSASRRLEKALNKELAGKARLVLVEQRITDMKTKQGLQQRMANADNVKELGYLEAEALLLKEQLATETAIKGVKDTTAFTKGKLQDLETMKLSKKALISEGLAKVTNTAQTHGLRAAMTHLRTELLTTEAALLKQSITMTRLDRVMFRLMGATAALAVSFQALMMKMMPWITVILMALPLIQGLAKWFGFGATAAKELSKANSAATESFDLLGARLRHVNDQFEKLTTPLEDGTRDIEAFNDGMLSFANTILTTTTALQAQQLAFATYQKVTHPLILFFTETLPGVIGMGTADAIKRHRTQLIEGIKTSKFGVSGAMKDLLDELKTADAGPVGLIDTSLGVTAKTKAANDKIIKAHNESTVKIQQNILDLSAVEAKALVTLESSIKGATEAARAFTNAFIITTNYDKPLSTLSQLTAALGAVDDDDKAVLTLKQRISHQEEINKNAAISALMTDEENAALDKLVKANLVLNVSEEDKLKNADAFEKKLKEIQDRLFRQQQAVIATKNNLASIASISKALSASTKVSAQAAEMRLNLEKETLDIKVQNSKMAVVDARIASTLTEEQVKQYAISKDLLDFENDALLKGKNRALVVSAINAERAFEITLLQEAIKDAQRLTQIDMSREKINLQNLKVQEKMNSLLLAQAVMQKRITKFQQTGSNTLTGAEEIKAIVEAEESRMKTAKQRLKIEQAINAARFLLLEEELKVLRDKAQEKADAYDLLGKQQQADGKDATKSNKELTRFQARIDGISTSINQISGASADAAAVITQTFDNAATAYLDKIINGLTKAVPGSGFDAFSATRDNATTGAAITASRAETTKKNDAIIARDDFDWQAADDEIATNNAAQAALETQASINLLESNMLSFADTIKDIFGEDGVLVAAFATVSANMLNVGQNFGDEYNAMNGTAGETAHKVSTVAATAAAAIGGMMQISSAQAQQQVGEIDKLIKAEEKRDGKSAGSVAKIKAMEAKKESIKRKAFETNKKMMMAQAVMSTAAAIASAIAGPPGLPWSAVFGAAAAAMGLAQINLIKGMTYAGGGGAAPTASTTSLTLGGGRNNSVDVAKPTTSGELSYIRGERGVGTNANNFKAGGGAATGIRGYNTGGAIMVGEQGPEQIVPSIDIIPNEDIGQGTTNITFAISAVDGQSVERMLNEQQGNIISMIQSAANDNGQEFLSSVDASVYNGTDG